MVHAFFLISCATILAEAAPTFAPRELERIVLVGDALIEREQRYGYLETALLTRFPKSRLHCRNLGWNADTLEGLSRAYFDPPEKGTERLFEEIKRQSPTLLIVGYGMAESLIDPAGAEAFGKRLDTFLEKALAGTPTTPILLSPIAHEDLGPPFPDPREHQQSLEAYTSAIQMVAVDRQFPFVDLFTRMSLAQREDRSLNPWTINGIHPNELGYWRLARLIEEGLDLPPRSITAEISFRRGLQQCENTTLTNRRAEITHAAEEASSNGKSFAARVQLEFDLTDDLLPRPLAPDGKTEVGGDDGISLRVTELPPGDYTLRIDDEIIARANAAEWGVGVRLVATPQHRQVEELRREVIRKNRLFFERYRPQNITYLLGFRSHEQGQNAKEIEALDALVAESEEKIFALQQPKTHHFELTRD